MLRGLRTALFVVDDLEAAKAFYDEAVGHGPYFDEAFYVGYSVEGFELGLLPSREGFKPGAGGTQVYFASDDIRAHTEALVALGARSAAEIQDVGDGIRTSDLLDPFGNRFGLIHNPHFAAPLTEAGAAEMAHKSILRTARVSLSSSEAWSRWATTEGLAKWWTAHSQIDLRPGGLYAIFFMPEAPAGERGADGCRVLSFAPGRMLSFTWNAPPQFPTTRARHTWVVVSFEDHDAGCQVTLEHLGWPSAGMQNAESEWPATFKYFETAWTQVMAQFEAGEAPS